MSSQEKSFEIPEDDVIMLESLLRSPAYGAFKRLVARYIEGSNSILMNGKEMSTIFEARGHIRGLRLVESLPVLVVKERDDRLKRVEDEKREREKGAYKNPFPIPTLPKKPEKVKSKKV